MLLINLQSWRLRFSENVTLQAKIWNHSSSTCFCPLYSLNLPQDTTVAFSSKVSTEFMFSSIYISVPKEGGATGRWWPFSCHEKEDDKLLAARRTKLGIWISSIYFNKRPWHEVGDGERHPKRKMQSTTPHQFFKPKTGAWGRYAPIWMLGTVPPLQPGMWDLRWHPPLVAR